MQEEEKVEEEVVEEETPTEEGVTETELHPLGEVTGVGVRLFEGKVVLSEGTRTVNDKLYHTIRLVDGSSYDLTDEEYELKITT